MRKNKQVITSISIVWTRLTQRKLIIGIYAGRTTARYKPQFQTEPKWHLPKKR